jgi:drug/metabolite transporter (DMT)-like permease
MREAIPDTDNRRGIALMLVAMAAFALEDAAIKAASEAYSTGQVILILGIGGAAVFWSLSLRAGASPLHRRALHPTVLVRCAAEAVAGFLFIKALALAPLATASAILQAAPLALVAGGALILGESVGWRRWSAVSVGFAGVLLILAPWSATFDPALLLAVGATFALAARDIVTRMVPRDIHSMQLSTWGYLALIPGGLVHLALGDAWGPVPVADAPLWAALIALGVVGYYAVTVSMRVGEVSVVAPFRYARLVFAAILGIVLFGEHPAPLAWAGAALVIGSGLYAMVREGRRPASAVMPAR